MTVLDAALKLLVAADVAVIFTVPTFLAVSFPVDLSTVAIEMSEDLKDFVPFAPVMETVVVFPTAIDDAAAFVVMVWAALLILNVFVMVPE